jgi:hypothetical protein
MTRHPLSATTTSSSIRAAEYPSVAGQYVSIAKTMPSLISGMVHRNDARNDWPLVQRKAKSVRELEAKCRHLVGKAELFSSRECAATTPNCCVPRNNCPHDLCSARAKCSRVLHARNVPVFCTRELFPSEPLFIAICELHRDGLDGTQVVR